MMRTRIGSQHLLRSRSIRHSLGRASVMPMRALPMNLHQGLAEAIEADAEDVVADSLAATKVGFPLPVLS
jgi:hypothetical protein